jgi:hypothetical protein
MAITQFTTAPKFYYAHLDDQAGTLGKLDGDIVFMNDATGALVIIEPPMVNFPTVLGEVGISNCQQILDRMHGGAAAIACARAN